MFLSKFSVDSCTLHKGGVTGGYVEILSTHFSSPGMGPSNCAGSLCNHAHYLHFSLSASCFTATSHPPGNEKDIDRICNALILVKAISSTGNGSPRRMHSPGWWEDPVPAPTLRLGTRHSGIRQWCWEHLWGSATCSPSQTLHPMAGNCNGAGYPSLRPLSAFLSLDVKHQWDTAYCCEAVWWGLAFFQVNTEHCFTGLTVFHSPELITFRYRLSSTPWCPVWLVFLPISPSPTFSFWWLWQERQGLILQGVNFL